MTRPSAREQYEEIELLYRENRNWLADAERSGKRSLQERRLKALRLLALRAARDTLFRLAQEAPEGSGNVVPADQHHERAA
jgi:hypothetical protein